MKRTVSILLLILMLLQSMVFAETVSVFKDVLPKNGTTQVFSASLLSGGTTVSKIVYGQNYSLKDMVLWITKQNQEVASGMADLVRFAYAVHNYGTVKYGSGSPTLTKDSSGQIEVNGQKYRVTGKSDCCGFTRFCFKTIFNKDIGDSVKSQCKTSDFTRICYRATGGSTTINIVAGGTCSLSSVTNYLEPGDLLFYCKYDSSIKNPNSSKYSAYNGWQNDKKNLTHVALYGGNGKVLECGSDKGGTNDVSECNFSQKDYRFVCALRVPV